ncbi:MAG: hypothetical protein NTW55_07750 [Planctomycetota bacterium]|nr:hypothetical protein [Planctomycetota bacterium]
MKEIDFLPEWYKNGKRRKLGYRTQYIVLGGIFAVMMVWNFVAAHSVSKAALGIAGLECQQRSAENTSKEYAKIESELSQLRKKTAVLDQIDSRIDVAVVLAEISFLIDRKIVLEKVVFSSEPFAAKSPNAGNKVRIAGDSLPSAQNLAGKIRFKVVINGVAAEAGDVAELIRRFEGSSYFCQVYPSFSRNKKVKTSSRLVENLPNLKKDGDSGDDYQVSEFEIGCYLANYRQEGTGFAKDSSNTNIKR